MGCRQKTRVLRDFGMQASFVCMPLRPTKKTEFRITNLETPRMTKESTPADITSRSRTVPRRPSRCGSRNGPNRGKFEPVENTELELLLHCAGRFFVYNFSYRCLVRIARVRSRETWSLHKSRPPLTQLGASLRLEVNRREVEFCK